MDGETEGPPIIIKRAKSSKNKGTLRTKAYSSGDPAAATDDAPGAAAQEDVSSVQRSIVRGPTGKAKAKEKKNSGVAGLSFAGNDEDGAEEDTFKVKKSTLSRKMQTEARLPSSLAQASISTPGPESEFAASSRPTYSAAYLSQLKAATRSLPSPRRGESPAASTGIYDEDDGALARAKYPEAFDGTSSIPTPSAVKAAKEKRERLRAQGQSEDFISLNAGQVMRRDDWETDTGPRRENTAVREEDELGDGEDDQAEYTGAQERIPLGKEARRKAEEKRRAGMMEMIEDMEEDDEEMAEWERAQIQRATREDRDVRERNAKAIKKPYRPAPIPEALPVPALSSASLRLSSALQNLSIAHAEHETQLSYAQNELSSLDEQETLLREEVEKVNRKEVWFREFSALMEELVGFLDDKYPRLESVESDLRALLAERTKLVQSRRAKDTEDDLSLFFGVPRRPPRRRAADDGDEEMEDAEEPSGDDGPSRSEIRETRRGQRRARREAQLTSPTPAGQPSEEEEGYATDSDLSPTDASALVSALADLPDRVANVMSDVKAPEYLDPSHPSGGVQGRFSEWRRRYAEDYRNAFGGLALVQVWEFWARWQMSSWDPFGTLGGVEGFPSELSAPKSLADFGWHTALSVFMHEGRTGTPTSDEDRDEEAEEDDVVSQLIQTVLIQKVVRMAEAGVYDPYSSKQTRRIRETVEEISYALKKDNRRFESLLSALLSPFYTAIDDHLYQLSSPPLRPAPPIDPAAPPARLVFLRGRLKLLANLLGWRRYLPERLRADFRSAVDRLVGGVMMPAVEEGWDVGGKEIAERVRKLVPPDLLSPATAKRLARR